MAVYGVSVTPLQDVLFHLLVMRGPCDTNSDLMAAREAQHATKVHAARARQAEEAALAARVQLESQRQTAAAQAVVRVPPASCSIPNCCSLPDMHASHSDKLPWPDFCCEYLTGCQTGRTPHDVRKLFG
jgi:hypothetical protein